MNQPTILPEGLDPVIKRQLETSLHGQYAFAAKTVWMGWIFLAIPLALGMMAVWMTLDLLGAGEVRQAVFAGLGAIVCSVVGYGMWASHQVQKKLSRQYQADMAAQSAD